MIFSYPVLFSKAYAEAQPFPHVVLRNGWDSGLIDQCKIDIAALRDWDGEKHARTSLRKRWNSRIRTLPASVQSVIQEASSPQFLAWLMEVTGEPGLLADPYLKGGGVHQIGRGGFLKIHADFNYHDKLKLYRRLNLLLYLNRDWCREWGGDLELWNQDVSRPIVIVPPSANTMVIFTTDDKSFHGHPHPLECPEDVTRDSIALYYYSAIKPDVNFARLRLNTDYR